MFFVFTLLYEIHNCSSESATPSIPAPDMDELMLTISLLKCIWHMINDVDHQLDFWWDCAQVRGFWGTLDFASSEKYNAIRRKTQQPLFKILSWQDQHYQKFSSETCMLTIIFVERESFTQHWSWAKEESIFSIGG